MSKWKIDDWVKTRSHGTPLTGDEIDFIRAGYRQHRKPRDVARDLRCATRTVNLYFAVFRAGGDTNVRNRAARGDASNPHVGPVPHRPCPLPNALPGISLAQLTSGRARPAKTSLS